MCIRVSPTEAGGAADAQVEKALKKWRIREQHERNSMTIFDKATEIRRVVRTGPKLPQFTRDLYLELRNGSIAMARRAPTNLKQK
eukprot:3697434-Alexandrium_andersonii.AAC.1